MADERSVPELGRTVDRHEAELREIRDKYVLKEVFEARVGPLEQNRSNTWLSNRNAILAVASMIIGIIVSAYIASKGG